jgi:hypothetical protein
MVIAILTKWFLVSLANFLKRYSMALSYSFTV